MGLRFRRRVELTPEPRGDAARSALAPALSLRGASTVIAPPAAGEAPADPAAEPGATLILDAEGQVQFVDDAGTPLPAGLSKRLRAAHGAEVREWLRRQCAAWNGVGDQLRDLHHATPAPEVPLAFRARLFEEPPPEPFVPRELDLLERSWPPHRKKLEAENAAGKQAYEEALWAWRRRRTAHEAAEEKRRKQLDIGRYGDRVVMERFLSEHLAGLAWPTEIALAFEISLDTHAVFLDVELPGPEVVPAREAAVAARGLRIRYLERSEAQVRRAYAWLVHATCFRLLGEVFMGLPAVERVVVSGYAPAAEHPDSAASAGAFLLSAEVERANWLQLDFDRLDALDLPAAFERFRLRRRMTKHGVFTAIEPFGAPLEGGLFQQHLMPAGSRPKR